MNNYADDFAPQEGKIWLNFASEGAIPNVAAEAAREAVDWKLKPYNLTLKRFAEVPKKLRQGLGRLIHVPAEDVILGNSASYGVHILANGFPFEAGDEILLMQNDFPTDIIPWLALQKKGVVVKQLKAKGAVLDPDEVEANLTQKTKFICLPHVHTFTGHVVDVEAIGKLCRNKGVYFVVNVSQSAGNRLVDAQGICADAIVCAGYKWLLGPYGTGFCWFRPELRKELDYNQSYWPTALTQEQLGSEDAIELKGMNSARKYDIFGTANFFNFCPWSASIDYLLDTGVENIQEYNQELVGQVIEGVLDSGYKLVSAEDSAKRSNLVVFSHPEKKNSDIFQALLHKGIYLGFWKGRLRAAPHIMNTIEDIHAFSEALK